MQSLRNVEALVGRAERAVSHHRRWKPQMETYRYKANAFIKSEGFQVRAAWHHAQKGPHILRASRLGCSSECFLLTELEPTPYLQGFITLVTFVCWIIHGFQATTWVSQNNLMRDALGAVDLTVLCIVSLELLGRIYVYGLRVVLKGWTTLDMMMVTASWVTVGGPYATVRVVRVFRLLRQIPNLRIVVESFMLAFPSIFWVLAIILMYISVFAVMGVSFFGEDFPTLYGSVSRASYSLFKATTLEGWVEDADTVYARYSLSLIHI